MSSLPERGECSGVGMTYEDGNVDCDEVDEVELCTRVPASASRITASAPEGRRHEEDDRESAIKSDKKASVTGSYVGVSGAIERIFCASGTEVQSSNSSSDVGMS